MIDKHYYKVLDLDENCTDDELQARYNELKGKYGEERFMEGERGNKAAKRLTEIEEAYREITAERKYTSGGGGVSYTAVEEFIRCGKLNEAQDALDGISERDAEWHYLQSVVFYKKNWVNESKKQLEIAIKMDASNEKYKQELDKLNNEINYNSHQFQSGNTKTDYTDVDDRQMGGNDCLNSCCQCLACNMLLNCCCNCH